MFYMLTLSMRYLKPTRMYWNELRRKETEYGYRRSIKTYMRMDPVVNDAYRLRKLLEKATGLKVYKSELIANYFNGYLSIVQEYKNETNPHITVAQGSWSIENGGEYKISLYTPTIVIKGWKMLNTRFVKDVAYKIVEALNDEFGENNWNTCNEEQKCWLPMSRNSFYLQIPNFEKY